MKKLLMTFAAIAAVLGAKAAFAADETIDVTAAVREAGAATFSAVNTSVSDSGPIANAFDGDLTSVDSRMMLKSATSKIEYKIGSSFEEGKNIWLEKYTLYRAVPTSDLEGDTANAVKRGPTKFRLYAVAQRKNDKGATLDEEILLDERDSIDWSTATEHTFEIDTRQLYGKSTRRYRLEFLASKAEKSDSVKYSLQEIKFFGKVTERAADETYHVTPLDFAYAYSGSGAKFPNYTPNLTDRIEMDVVFGSVTESQGLFCARLTSTEKSFTVYYSTTTGWTLNYGGNAQAYGSNVFAQPGVRYHIVADLYNLKNVTINGRSLFTEPIEAVDCAAGGALWMCRNVVKNADSSLPFTGRVYGLRAWNKDGDLICDLVPSAFIEGTVGLLDQVTGVAAEPAYSNLDNKSIAGVQRKIKDAFFEDPAVINLTKRVHAADAATVTLVEGSASPSYPVENLFTNGQTSEDRFLAYEKKLVIQYDIADTFCPGEKIELTHFAILPEVGDAIGLRGVRGPTIFELQGGTIADNGEGTVATNWVTLVRRDRGVGAVSYQGNAFFVKIPFESRGDYRHYRFVTEDSNAPDSESVKIGLQEIRFYGRVAPDEEYEPIDYVSNEDSGSSFTWFNTGFTPDGASAIEMSAEFWKIESKAQCLFCSRGKSSANPWVLWKSGNGKFKLSYNTDTTTESAVTPTTGTKYVLKAVGNKLYLDGALIETAGGESATFVPGSVIALLASHSAGADLGSATKMDNQGHLRLRACRIWDGQGDLVRDYLPMKRKSDGAAGLFDRVNRTFITPNGVAARAGAAADAAFASLDQAVEVTSTDDKGRLNLKEVTFEFAENAVVGAELLAALGNEWGGNDPEDWVACVKVADVPQGTRTLTAKVENPQRYSKVRFFLRDKSGKVRAMTATGKILSKGLIIVFE